MKKNMEEAIKLLKQVLNILTSGKFIIKPEAGKAYYMDFKESTGYNRCYVYIKDKPTIKNYVVSSIVISDRIILSSNMQEFIEDIQTKFERANHIEEISVYKFNQKWTTAESIINSIKNL